MFLPSSKLKKKPKLNIVKLAADWGRQYKRRSKPKMLNPGVLRSKIKVCAYHMWLNAGKPESKDKEFWTEAEKKVLTDIKAIKGEVNEI